MNNNTENNVPKISNGIHNNNLDKNFPGKTPPPRRSFDLPILQKLIQIYKLWQEYLPNFPKTSRHLNFKIGALFIEIIELFTIAAYSTKVEKLFYLKKASMKIDLIKLFMQISWEIKTLDNKKYIKISYQLNEVGKMLGGWKKQLEK